MACHDMANFGNGLSHSSHGNSGYSTKLNSSSEAPSSVWQHLQPHIRDAIMTLIDASSNTKCLPVKGVAIEKFSSDQFEKFSRLITRALRHVPEAFGIEMDRDGWVDLNQLAELLSSQSASCEQWSVATVAHLLAISNLNQRFQVSATHCRASYGHSTTSFQPTDVDCPEVPLYHGTNAATLLSIASVGLLPMRRRFIQLSTDLTYVRSLAELHGSQAGLIRVDPATAIRQGVQFFNTQTHVWLSTPIPPDCCEFVSATGK